MAGLEIPKGVSAKDFFNKFLPEVFHIGVANMDLSGYKGIHFAMEFILTGTDGGAYGICLRDGDTLEVKEGKIEGAMFTLEMANEAFMHELEGLSEKISELPIEKITTILPVFTKISPNEAKKKIESLKGIKGLLEIEAQRDNQKIEIYVKFNGADTPFCKIRGSVNELMSLVMGQINPVMGFISGKFKFEGDMPFALELQALASF